MTAATAIRRGEIEALVDEANEAYQALSEAVQAREVIEVVECEALRRYERAARELAEAQVVLAMGDER